MGEEGVRRVGWADLELKFLDIPTYDKPSFVIAWIGSGSDTIVFTHGIVTN